MLVNGKLERKLEIFIGFFVEDKTVKSGLKECLICRRFKVRPGNQITAPLPENRTQAEFPFETVGIDFTTQRTMKKRTYPYLLVRSHSCHSS
ncbi:hypothetical protein TNCV_1042221 [Trichonephila clavipes]|nr:hypothetical protein TNCV_1042221 [Trichonephila clavipes]